MKKLENLGWQNAGGETEKTIDKYREMCRALNHQRTDLDISGNYSGTEHVVTCKECGYFYRYDSSD